MAQAHVPAWRKFGLKLKHVDNKPDIVSSGDGHKKSLHVSMEVEPQAVNGRKKRKLSPSTDQPRQPYPDNRTELHAPSRLTDHSVDKASRSASRSVDSKILQDSSKTEKHVNGHLVTNGKKESGKQQKRERRKSVSFAPGTKQEEAPGEIGVFSELHAQADNEGSAQALSTTLPTTVRGVGNEIKRSKRPKKPKRSKSTLLANQSNDTPGSAGLSDANSVSTEPRRSPLVEYIELFYRDRGNWKFNKARQNHVFKFIFDIGKIPSSHDEALVAYIEGLQGGTARDQLRGRAIQIREQDIQDGLDGDNQPGTDGPNSEMTSGKRVDGPNQHDQLSPDIERERAAYRAGLRRFREKQKWGLINQEEEGFQLSAEWEHRLRRRQRSEAILAKLGTKRRPGELVSTLNTPERQRNGIHFVVERTVENKSDANGDVMGTKRKRQRKRRTAMPVDDSSSEETSSSEDDSEPEQTLKRARLLVENHRKKANKIAKGRAKPKESKSEKPDSGASSSEDETSSNGEESTSSGGSRSSSSSSSDDDSGDSSD